MRLENFVRIKGTTCLHIFYSSFFYRKMLACVRDYLVLASAELCYLVPA
jgi:hypothetical protein